MIDETKPDVEKLEELARQGEADLRPGPQDATDRDRAPAAQEPPQPSKRRGRPPGSKSKKKVESSSTPGPAGPGIAPAPAPIIPAAAMRAIIQAPYAMAAARYGDHWALTDAEADVMIPAHLAVAEEYLPAVLHKHAALYTVAFLHLLTIFGKTQIHYKLKAELEKPETEKARIRMAEAPGVGPARETEPLRSHVRPGPKETAPGA